MWWAIAFGGLRRRPDGTATDLVTWVSVVWAATETDALEQAAGKFYVRNPGLLSSVPSVVALPGMVLRPGEGTPDAP